MEMVETIFDMLNTVESRIWGTIILVGVIGLDFLLARDGVEGNSIRDILMQMSQSQLRTATPYGLGLLVGHFYHPPETEGLIALGWWWNVITAISIGVVLLIMNLWRGVPKSEHVFYVALFGILVGIFVWPV